MRRRSLSAIGTWNAWTSAFNEHWMGMLMESGPAHAQVSNQLRAERMELKPLQAQMLTVKTEAKLGMGVCLTVEK